MGERESMGKTVTSVKVDEDLWKEAKKAAIDDDISLTDLLDDALRDWMTNRKKESK
jgi:hypothetical protein